MKQGSEAIPQLTPALAKELVGQAGQERAYRRRAVIFREGDPCSGLHILTRGQVKLARSSGGKEQLLAILTPGDLLDPIPLLDEGSHSVSATAREAVALYFIPRAIALDLIWNHPVVLSAVLHVVSERLRNLATLASDLAFKDVTARVCKLLLDQAESEGQAARDGVHLKRTLTQQELAALVGTAREVAWRSLKKLEEEGLIKIERHQITLLDVERLATMT